MDLKEADKQGSYSSLANEICGEKMAMKEDKKKTDNTETETLQGEAVHDLLDLMDANGKHVALSDFKGK